MKLRKVLTSGRKSARLIVAAAGLAIPLAAKAGDYLFTGPDGSGNLQDPTQWFPNGVPSTGDTATILNRSQILMNQNFAVGTLTLSNTGLYETGNILTVGGTTTVSGAAGYLRVDDLFPNPPGVSFQTAALNIATGGTVFMNYSGSHAKATGSVSIDSTSTLAGEGWLEVGGTLNNNGTLQAKNSELDITPIGAGKVTLSGSNGTGNVVVNTPQAALKITAPINGGFIGTMTIGAGNSVSLYSWTLGEHFFLQGWLGTLNMNGGTPPSLFSQGGPPAQLIGMTNNQHTINGTVNVTGYAQILGTTLFNPSATVNVASGGLLSLGNASGIGGQIAYAGGTFNASQGIIRHDTDAVVSENANVTINAAILDLDGVNNNSSLTIQDGATFTINAGGIDTTFLFGEPSFHAYMTVGNGTLAVNTPNGWILTGQLVMGGTLGQNIPNSVINGSQLTVHGDGVNTGIVNVQDPLAVINAPVQFGNGTAATAGVNLSPTGRLQLVGPTTYAGANVDGILSYGPGGPNLCGRVDQYGDATVTADSTVMVDTYNMDGNGTTTITVNPGVNFYVKSNNISVNPGNNFRGTMSLNGGHIDMANQAHQWTLPAGATINMTNTGIVPQITGDTLRLSGGTINATGDSTIGAPLQNSDGLIKVNSGTLSLNGTFSSAPGAALTKSGAGTLVINGAQSHGPSSSLDVSGGSAVFNTDAGAGGSNLTVINEASTKTYFNSTQRLSGLAVADGAVAQLTGAGSNVLVTPNLIMSPKALLDLTNNDMIFQSTPANAKTDLANLTALIKSARNTSPALWQGYGISSSAAAVYPKQLTGLGIILNQKAGPNNTVLPIYNMFDGQPVNTSSILVKYTWNGDPNLDGIVNFDDYFLINTGFLSNGALGGYRNGDFNFDGIINFDDYFLINSAFLGQNQTLAVHTAVLVPEPGLAGLALLAAGGLAMRRKRRA